MQKMKPLTRFFAWAIICLWFNPAAVQAGPLFDHSEPLNLSLQGPFKAMFRKAQTGAEHPATLSFTNDAGETISLDVQIRTRGISRRKKDTCQFPPLKISFDKTQTDDTVFKGQESLKLVTHCNKGDRYQQYYAKEYLIYRTYNLFTPLSFQVRLANINYQYTDSKKNYANQFAFFIEDIDDVAKRNELKEIVVGDINPDRLNPATADRYALFQFMMGNVDWSFLSGPDPNECCHNTKLIGLREPDSPLYPVPYDFDATGMVDTHYSVPPLSLKINKVTQRLYRGFCVHQVHLPDSLAQVRSLKDEIYSTMVEDPLLLPSTQSKARRFLDGFYKLIDDPEQLAKKIEGKCRGK